MQDLEGKMIKTASGTQYLLTEKIGEGAQGVVYDEAMDKFLIKLKYRTIRINLLNRWR